VWYIAWKQTGNASFHILHSSFVSQHLKPYTDFHQITHSAPWKYTNRNTF
jgi:hypothetical protein